LRSTDFRDAYYLNEEARQRFTLYLSHFLQEELK